MIHFKMKAAALKATAEKYHTTVTAYSLALLFWRERQRLTSCRGEASIQVPVNMRKFYLSDTVRNFSMYCGIRLPLEKISGLASMIGEIDGQLRRKASEEAMREMLTATEKMVGMMRYIPFAVKQPVAKLAYGFLGDKIFTNTLSNLGVAQLPPAVSAQIESMDFVLGAAITNRAACALVTVNDTATLSITKMTVDPTFEEKLDALLTADGSPVAAEGSECYEA